MESELAEYLGDNDVLTEVQLLNLLLEHPTQTLTASETANIIELLGGLHVVTTAMLRSSMLLGGNMPLDNRKKMQQLLKGLNGTSTEITYSSMSSIQEDNITTAEIEQNVVLQNDRDPKWTLIKNNNLLHDKCPWIHDHLYSNWLLVIFGMFVIVSAVFYSLLNAADISINFIFLLFPSLAWLTIIPWSISVLLSVNRAMISEIASTADTWIEATAGMLVGVYSGLHMSRSEKFANVPLSINIFRNVTLSCLFCTFLLVICSVDGLQGWKRHSKILMVILMSLFCWGWFVYLEYFAEESQMETMFGTISITARAAQAFEVLLIFLCKQAVNTWRNKNEQCVVVRCAPYIEWKEEPPKSSAPHSSGVDDV